MLKVSLFEGDKILQEKVFAYKTQAVSWLLSSDFFPKYKNNDEEWEHIDSGVEAIISTTQIEGEYHAHLKINTAVYLSC